MVLMIKNARADRAVRELARRTGETIAEAVTIAAEERLAKLPAAEERRSGSVDRVRLEAILAKFRANHVDDPRTDDEIIGYDENGLPS
ncbi:type II toxin-antitoxin system VapB family antitoxin [Bosea sp. 124]|uniref:type II toxin-antitoxin system VapB family antitoxin n=1 Tax=Bosea sp. 124 TaxID=2135642 RepID=UPI000D333CB2|nr:type II toxin-antitoxin system VapB family antitoxin [Bosea sp. 124]PTM39057.1 antitoxin VapB [Bosea sp. 124]